MCLSKWDDVKSKLLLVRGWARNGLTDEQIIKNLGISVETFYKYKREHTELAEALKESREVADIMVESALFKRAVGYQYTERKKVVNDDGSEVHTTTLKDVAPDVGASVFWLKNRKPEAWRDKIDIVAEHNINVGFGVLAAAEQMQQIAEDKPTFVPGFIETEFTEVQNDI